MNFLSVPPSHPQQPALRRDLQPCKGWQKLQAGLGPRHWTQMLASQEQPGEVWLDLLPEEAMHCQHLGLGFNSEGQICHWGWWIMAWPGRESSVRGQSESELRGTLFGIKHDRQVPAREQRALAHCQGVEEMGICSTSEPWGGCLRGRMFGACSAGGAAMCLLWQLWQGGLRAGPQLLVGLCQRCQQEVGCSVGALAGEHLRANWHHLCPASPRAGCRCSVDGGGAAEGELERFRGFQGSLIELPLLLLCAGSAGVQPESH